MWEGQRHSLARAPIRHVLTSGKDSTKMELLPEEQGVQVPHWAPQLKGPAPERQDPKTTGFEDHLDLDLGEPVGSRKQRLCS